MGRLTKFFLYLIVLGFIGLVGFAYLGDLTPEEEAVSEPLDINVD